MFDGGTPALKRRTVLMRQQRRQTQEAKLKRSAQRLLLMQMERRRIDASRNQRESKENTAFTAVSLPAVSSSSAAVGDAGSGAGHGGGGTGAGGSSSSSSSGAGASATSAASSGAATAAAGVIDISGDEAENEQVEDDGHDEGPVTRKRVRFSASGAGPDGGAAIGDGGESHDGDDYDHDDGIGAAGASDLDGGRSGKPKKRLGQKRRRADAFRKLVASVNSGTSLSDLDSSAVGAAASSSIGRDRAGPLNKIGRLATKAYRADRAAMAADAGAGHTEDGDIDGLGSGDEDDDDEDEDGAGFIADDALQDAALDDVGDADGAGDGGELFGDAADRKRSRHPIARFVDAKAPVRPSSGGAGAGVDDEDGDDSDGGGPDQDWMPVLPSSVDEVDLSVLSSLPPHLQKDYIAAVKQQVRQESRGALMPVAADPEAFSRAQLGSYIKTSTLNIKIESMNQEAAKKYVSGKRIASEANREYLLVRDGDADKNAAEDGGNGGHPKHSSQRHHNSGSGSGRSRHAGGGVSESKGDDGDAAGDDDNDQDGNGYGADNGYARGGSDDEYDDGYEHHALDGDNQQYGDGDDEGGGDPMARFSLRRILGSDADIARVPRDAVADAVAATQPKITDREKALLYLKRSNFRFRKGADGGGSVSASAAAAVHRQSIDVGGGFISSLGDGNSGGYSRGGWRGGRGGRGAGRGGGLNRMTAESIGKVRDKRVQGMLDALDPTGGSAAGRLTTHYDAMLKRQAGMGLSGRLESPHASAGEGAVDGSGSKQERSSSAATATTAAAHSSRKQSTAVTAASASSQSDGGIEVAGITPHGDAEYVGQFRFSLERGGQGGTKPATSGSQDQKSSADGAGAGAIDVDDNEDDDEVDIDDGDGMDGAGNDGEVEDEDEECGGFMLDEQAELGVDAADDDDLDHGLGDDDLQRALRMSMEGQQQPQPQRELEDYHDNSDDDDGDDGGGFITSDAARVHGRQKEQQVSAAQAAAATASNDDAQEWDDVDSQGDDTEAATAAAQPLANDDDWDDIDDDAAVGPDAIQAVPSSMLPEGTARPSSSSAAEAPCDVAVAAKKAQALQWLYGDEGEAHGTTTTSAPMPASALVAAPPRVAAAASSADADVVVLIDSDDDDGAKGRRGVHDQRRDDAADNDGAIAAAVAADLDDQDAREEARGVDFEAVQADNGDYADFDDNNDDDRFDDGHDDIRAAFRSAVQKKKKPTGQSTAASSSGDHFGDSTASDSLGGRDANEDALAAAVETAGKMAQWAERAMRRALKSMNVVPPQPQSAVEAVRRPPQSHSSAVAMAPPTNSSPAIRRQASSHSAPSSSSAAAPSKPTATTSMASDRGTVAATSASATPTQSESKGAGTAAVDSRGDADKDQLDGNVEESDDDDEVLPITTSPAAKLARILGNRAAGLASSSSSPSAGSGAHGSSTIEIDDDEDADLLRVQNEMAADIIGNGTEGGSDGAGGALSATRSKFSSPNRSAAGAASSAAATSSSPAAVAASAAGGSALSLLRSPARDTSTPPGSAKRVTSASASPAASPSVEAGQVGTADHERNVLAAIEAEEATLRLNARTAARDSDVITETMREEVMALLDLFGCPYIIAPMEAEAQCAALEEAGLVDGVITDDSDAFLFGSRMVYKNIFDDRKFVEVYRLDDVTREMGLDRQDLIRSALLLGSDYTNGVRGVGIVNAVEVLQCFPGDEGLEEFRDWIHSSEPQRKKPSKSELAEMDKRARFKATHRSARQNWEVSEGFPNRSVLAAYRSPTVTHFTSQEFSGSLKKWKAPNLDGLRIVCKEKFGWMQQQCDEQLLPVMRELSSGVRQTTLESYMLSYHDNAKAAKIKSKRMRDAVQRLAGTGDISSMVLLDDDGDVGQSLSQPRRASPARQSTPERGSAGAGSSSRPSPTLEVGHGARSSADGAAGGAKASPAKAAAAPAPKQPTKRLRKASGAAPASTAAGAGLNAVDDGNGSSAVVDLSLDSDGDEGDDVTVAPSITGGTGSQVASTSASAAARARSRSTTSTSGPKSSVRVVDGEDEGSDSESETGDAAGEEVNDDDGGDDDDDDDYDIGEGFVRRRKAGAGGGVKAKGKSRASSKTGSSVKSAPKGKGKKAAEE